MKESNPTSNQPKETLLWAIDPFEKDTSPDPALVQKLLDWVKAANLDIQPVHILALPEDAAETLLECAGLLDYVKAAENALDGYLREVGFLSEGCKPAKVLLASPTPKENVLDLIRYAKESGCSCIVISSHGRSGFQRFIAGSFAENLLHYSPLPLFLLTHLTDAPENNQPMKRALFATDFSDSARDAFLSFLPSAKRLGFDLSIFYSVSLPSSAFISNNGQPALIPEDYFSSQMSWAVKEGDRWVKLAEKEGIASHFIVKDDGLGPDTGESILSAAQLEDAGLIVMASRSNSVTSFIMGSVARDVFRSNRYPVWVYGPKAIFKHGTLLAESAASA